MKTIIAGGRDYVLTPADYILLDQLRWQLPITEVVSGRATGADDCGYYWAIDLGIKTRSFPAFWDNIEAFGAVVKTRRDGTKYNALAGFWRNQQMADYADTLIAFPGGSGTKDMIERADAKGLKVIQVFGGEFKPLDHEQTK